MANINGNGGSNVLYGTNAADLIDGKTGADTMTGYAGNDVYIVDDAGDIVVEAPGGGTDLVKSSVTYVLGANVENLILTGNANIFGVGNALNNVIIGNDGNNILSGDLGNDTLIGGKGNDDYVVESAGDKIIESAGGGTDTVYSDVSFSLAGLANVENLVLNNNNAKINGTGNALDNHISGNDHENVINGGQGVDTMTGGKGDDTYYVDNALDQVKENAGEGTDTVISTVALNASFGNIEIYQFMTKTAVNFTADAAVVEVHGGSGNDTITAKVGDDHLLYGNAGNDTLTGGDKADYIDGGTGADTMTGGTGADIYVVDNVLDTVSEDPMAADDDTVRSTISIAKLWDGVEDIELAGHANLNATGNDLVNVIYGNAGANVLDGGGGGDHMFGFGGNDTYFVDNAGDAAIESIGGGIDTVKSTLSWTLDANVENLTLLGGLSIDGTGNDLNNVITGNDGANFIDGGTGADTLIGGKGSDVYFVDNVGDKIVETATAANGGGNDWVETSVSFSIAGFANVDNISLLGSQGLSATGNALDNAIFGNSGANIINGGKGADTMSGGDGDDTYYVDNLGDHVAESNGPNSGHDTIISSIALKDAVDNVEDYTFTTKTDLHFTGNTLDNVIVGGSGNDFIDGGGGQDQIHGGAGNDHLVGGSLADLLDGGTGADVMEGGDGNDSYVVDNIHDKVSEDPGHGTHDTVYSTVSIGLLWDNVEDVYLEGSGKLNATGNGLDNTIGGNSGNNVLNGGDGKDLLDGGRGDDTLIGGSGADTFEVSLSGSQGHDTVKDFLKAEDILSFTGVGDQDKSGTVDGQDLAMLITGIVDHGLGQAVDVHFKGGGEVTFEGIGTNNINSIDQIASQIHVQ